MLSHNRLFILVLFLSIALSHATTKDEKELSKLLSSVARNYDFGSLRGLRFQTDFATIQIDEGKTFRAKVVATEPCFKDSAVYLFTKDTLFRKVNSSAKPDTGTRLGVFDFRNQLADVKNASLLSDTVVNKVRYRRIANAEFSAIWFWLGLIPTYPIQGAHAVYWVNAKTNLITHITAVINHMGTASNGLLYSISLNDYKNMGGVQIPTKISFSLPEMDHLMTPQKMRGLVFGTPIAPASCSTYETQYQETRTTSEAKANQLKSVLLSSVDLYLRVVAEKVLNNRDSLTIEVKSVEKMNHAITWSY